MPSPEVEKTWRPSDEVAPERPSKEEARRSEEEHTDMIGGVSKVAIEARSDAP